MRKVFARLRLLVEKESMSLWFISLGVCLNILAWVIPRDSYGLPHRDPIGLTKLVADHITDARTVTYFWHALLSLTVVGTVISLYKVAGHAAEFFGTRFDP